MKKMKRMKRKKKKKENTGWSELCWQMVYVVVVYGVVVPVLPESNSTWLFEIGCDLRAGLFKRRTKKNIEKHRRTKKHKMWHRLNSNKSNAKVLAVKKMLII